MWYLYDRFGPDDKIIDLIDSKGKKVKLKNPKDLFKYLKYRFPSK